MNSSKTSKLVKKCDQCDYSNETEKGLNQHIRMKHKITQLDGLEDSIVETYKRPEVKERESQTDNNVQSKENKNVQTESNIDLIIEGKVCVDCEEELIGETLWRIPDDFYLDIWHTHSVRRSPVEGCKVNQHNGNIVNKKTYDVIGTVVDGTTPTLY